MLHYNTINDLLKKSLIKLMQSDVFNDFGLLAVQH